MNPIQQLLNDIQTITQSQSLTMIDKDIALQKTRKLYEEISVLPTQKVVEHHTIKPIEIKPDPIIETPKAEVKEAITTAINPIAETVKTETAKPELNTESLNDILNKNRKSELADKLEHLPIKDLKASIGFNDKFSFIQNLFAGNDAAYKNAVDQLNSFTTKTEAEQFLNDLSKQHKWTDAEDVAEYFKELINRKFL